MSISSFNIRSARAKSSGFVILKLSSAPWVIATLNPASCATATSSSAGIVRRSCAARISSNRNPCGVCARHSPSRASGVSIVSSPRQSASTTGRAGNAPACVSRALTTSSIMLTETKGRAASWINTISGANPFNAFRPAKTESCRSSPPIQTGSNPDMPLTEVSYSLTSSEWMTTCTASTSACANNARIERRSTVCPLRSRYCLGMPPPARFPRPAATINPATFISPPAFIPA